MIIDDVRQREDFKRIQTAVQQPQQGQWTNWDSAIQRSLTWKDIWQMALLRISFLIRSVYDLLPSNANLVRWGKKDDLTCPLCHGRQTTEHVLSSCKVALLQGRYTWRHNRVLQELASVPPPPSIFLPVSNVAVAVVVLLLLLVVVVVVIIEVVVVVIIIKVVEIVVVMKKEVGHPSATALPQN
ncbi:polyprotein [Elysia marginata]|uniref:Polyprotein n=1 Tax=Elysia marginata TaxID=1093978 RepID=A0AAV4JS65_9GAST|nr:polyprotein [Elysia marginata]